MSSDVLISPAPLFCMADPAGAALISLLGAGSFGMLIGWYVYFINRYRKADVQLSDLATVVGVLGGAAVLALFPASSPLFGAYGIGLGIGFFGYFLVLVYLVWRSEKFGVDWFLDGRREEPTPPIALPQTIQGPLRPAFAPQMQNVTIQSGANVAIHGTPQVKPAD